MWKKSLCTVLFLLLLSTLVTAQEAQNVILLIGDGMGVTQREATRLYLGRDLAMDSDLSVLITTHSANNQTTDSAAAATALATGKKTNNGLLSIDPEGRHLPTILEEAKKKGLATGLVATSAITHATPAAFGAHRANRNDELGVALDYLENKVDLLMGGGKSFFLPTKEGGKRTDGRNLVAEFKELGYRAAFSEEELAAIPFLPALVLFDEFPYALDNDGSYPTMAEMTKEALRLMENEAGFFLMVEGSQIDWACHANDPIATLSEIAAFDQAVEAALEFATKHPQTLVIVVGDHETGGLKLTGEGDPSMLKDAKLSVGKLAALLEKNPDTAHELFCENVGVCPLPWELDKLMAKSNLERELSLFISEQAGLSWSTTGHTGAPLPLTAFGASAELFAQATDNTQVPQLIAKALGFEL